MSENQKDAGMILALLERLEQQRLPRLLEMLERVDRGERLSEFDISFLGESLETAQEIGPLIDRHPEYQGLVAKVINLYKEITDKALANEQSAG